MKKPTTRKDRLVCPLCGKIYTTFTEEARQRKELQVWVGSYKVKGKGWVEGHYEPRTSPARPSRVVTAKQRLSGHLHTTVYGISPHGLKGIDYRKVMDKALKMSVI